MPWDAASFAKHNRSLTPEQSGHAARIANAILHRSGNEGMAIATANKLSHRDAGGGIAAPYEMPQTLEQASPAAQGMVQRYAGMPTERLQELAVMLRGSPQADIIARVLQGKELMPEAKARRGGGLKKRAAGGGAPVMSASQGSPWWTRTQAYQSNKPGLFLHGSTPGRADMVHTIAPPGAHIIPADVISGMGQGNSLNGASQFEKMLKSGPYGTAPVPTGRHGMGMPRASAASHLARGGAHRETPVALSDGEFMVFEHWVRHLGGGDPKKGKQLLNKMILDERKKHIKTLQRLPGPVKEGT